METAERMRVKAREIYENIDQKCYSIIFCSMYQLSVAVLRSNNKSIECQAFDQISNEMHTLFIHNEDKRN